MNWWWPVAALTAAASTGAACQAVGERRDRRRFPPAGTMVRLPRAQGGHALHAVVTPPPGGRAPWVVFEAALGASALSWVLVQRQVAAFAPTVAYDRAGMGWSEPGPMPRTGARVIADLRALLRELSVPPPYILAGHSYGGLLARAFAAEFPEEIAGLVLVDAAAPEQWTAPASHDRLRLRVGRHLCRRGVWAARLGVARAVAWLATRGAERRPPGSDPERDLHVRAARGVVTAVTMGILGRSDRGLLTPVHNLPPEARRPLAALWIQPKYYAALASQIEVLPALAAEVAAREAARKAPLPAPAIVLSAAGPTPARVAEQERAAALSARGRHEIVAECGHWIPLDRPDAVVAAIREVAARAPANSARG
ncbi:MAG TPA: alpha/beta hydrolase [Terriglobales bacterium]|nr:alpha/beta hydrolase [Terriglobales bacterium]